MNDQDLVIYEYKKDALNQIIKDALNASTEAHNILFRNTNEKQNEIMAILYLNKAISLMASAKSIYVSNIELLSNVDIESMFYKFNIFETEFLTNFSSDHSHQWTDIEFSKFKEMVDYFIN